MPLATSVSIGEAAALLGIDPRTVRRHLRKGMLTGHKPGAHWRISRESIDALLHGGIPASSPATISPANSSLADRKARVEEIRLQIDEEKASATLEQIRSDKLEAQRRQQEQEQADADHVRSLQETDRSEREGRRREQQRQQSDARARRDFQREKLSAARGMVPAGLPDDATFAALDAVRDKLPEFFEMDDEDMADYQIAATVRTTIRPYVRRKEAREFALSALRHLNPLAKSYSGQPKSKWEALAQKKATAAVIDLPHSATPLEMAEAALAAIAEVNSEFAHSERLARAMTLYLPRTLAQLLPLTGQDKGERARKAVEGAYAQLSIGATDAEFDAARDAALQPYVTAEQEAKAAKNTADARSRLELQADCVFLPYVASHLAFLEASPNGWHFEPGERTKLVETIKAEIRPTLLAELAADPDAVSRARVEELVDDWLELRESA